LRYELKTCLKMKEILNALRRIDVLIIAAVLCALVLLYGNSSGKNVPGASEQEIRMQNILSEIEGAGKVKVMIAEDEEGRPVGVLATAPGGDDIRVMLEIQRAVITLTGLEAEHIEIVKSER